MCWSVLAMLALLRLASVTADTENMVGILSGLSGYNQIVTSSTLRWITPADGKVPENAVKGAELQDNVDDGQVLKDVWVCRARAHNNNMWLAGILTTNDKTKSTQCVVSNHGIVQPYQNYEVLQNVEDGGKLSWMKWDNLHAPPGGSVAIGIESMNFIGRRKANDPTSTVNYHLGRIEKGLMGKIYVIEGDVERSYDDGEVLVETEPIRYEMNNVKFNYFRAKYDREELILGETVMRNEDIPAEDGSEEEISRVDTVIAYNHNRTVTWGQGHAILSGLPMRVLHNNGTLIEEFKWAMDNFTNHSSTYAVETFLSPGRGVNVTLKGNWTESNIPYTAKVTAIFQDGSKKPRHITGSKREVGIRNVHPEFGPVYFLHNNTHVPTTTTTTTSTTTIKSTTTSATTSRTTSTSERVKPIPPSPMEEMNSTTKKGDVSDPGKKKENQSWPNDEPKSELSESSGPSRGSVLREGTAVFISVIMVLSLFT